MTEPAGLPPELHEQMRRAIHSGIKRRSRRNRLLAGGAIGVLAVSLAGAAWAVTLPAGIRDRTVTCYEAADLGSRSVTSQYSFQEYPEHPEAAAIENCELLWSNGVLKSAEVVSGGVPKLELCSGNDGGLNAFPRRVDEIDSSAAFCRQLSLVPAPAGR